MRLTLCLALIAAPALSFQPTVPGRVATELKSSSYLDNIGKSGGFSFSSAAPAAPAAPAAAANAPAPTSGAYLSGLSHGSLDFSFLPKAAAAPPAPAAPAAPPAAPAAAAPAAAAPFTFSLGAPIPSSKVGAAAPSGSSYAPSGRGKPAAASSGIGSYLESI